VNSKYFLYLAAIYITKPHEFLRKRIVSFKNPNVYALYIRHSSYAQKDFDFAFHSIIL